MDALRNKMLPDMQRYFDSGFKKINQIDFKCNVELVLHILNGNSKEASSIIIKDDFVVDYVCGNETIGLAFLCCLYSPETLFALIAKKYPITGYSCNEVQQSCLGINQISDAIINSSPALQGEGSEEIGDIGKIFLDILTPKN